MRKTIFRMLAVLFFVVICVSAGVIYFTFDTRALKYLTTFQPEYCLLALGILSVGLFFDASRLITLTHLSGEKMDYKHVFNVVFSNYFLALLTPGQGGGGVAQLMFMKRAGVSVAKSTLIIIVRTVMSILFLFLTVPIVFYFDPGLVSWMPPSLIALICLFVIFAPGLLIFYIITGRFERWLIRFCRRFSPKVQEAVFLWYRDFQQALFLLGKNPKQVLRAFAESGASLLCIYGVVPVFIHAFGITDVPLHIIMGRMCLVNLVLYFTPTPGGTGVAEGGFLVMFNPLLPAGVTGVIAVMWRFFCEYIPFTIGAIVTIRYFGLDILTQIRRRSSDE
jgi:uncharacterized protein (TIRG00374 family)